MVGRNGLHRYNNQDHAMLTGMLAVRNLLHGENHDLWAVNAEQEYHEEVRVDSAEHARLDAARAHHGPNGTKRSTAASQCSSQRWIESEAQLRTVQSWNSCTRN